MADPALRVLVVWVPFLGGTRGAINSSVFPDHRVTSLWDQHAASSAWFSQHVTGQPGPTWDYYMLFSSRARWGRRSRPSHQPGRAGHRRERSAADGDPPAAAVAGPASGSQGTIATAWTGDSLIRHARALGRYMGWANAVLLWLAGAYIVYYWLTAIRLF